jgi:phosphoglycolate phosphatase-like HAD superfamily hydrolase
MTVQDPLPSWSDGPAKSAILGFIARVTEPGSCFIPVTERLATFDNDGTLWCEKPMYPQADFLLRRWAIQVKTDPARAVDQPWKAVAEGDQAWLAAMLDNIPDVIRGVTRAYDGITTATFDAAVRGFFDSATHPKFGVPYTKCGFQPMRELLDLLVASEFAVYICSAGGRDFVRVISEEMYGIPRDRVIGSGTTLEYRDGDVYRTAGIDQPIDDGPGKPVHIWTRTGRKPLFAGGNADGDTAMLETATFGLLVRHDDAEREFAYDTGAENALAAAADRGWTVVSMKDDFKTVF